MRAGTRLLSMFAALLVAPAALFAQPGGRLIEAADISESDTHVDVVVLFSCPIRYLSHLPATQGEVVDVRLGLTSECQGAGSAVTSESLPAPAGQGVLRSMELTPLLGNEVDLKLTWGTRESFLVAPTSDLRGLRVRLVRDGRNADRSRVLITEPEGTLATGYAINLESSQSPFPASAAQDVQRDLGQAAYLSTATLDGQEWFRLPTLHTERVGKTPNLRFPSVDCQVYTGIERSLKCPIKRSPRQKKK